MGKSERVVVVDESFIHFCTGADSVIPLLGEYPNLLVVCSMTKCYAIPGLRLGYILGSEALIEQLKRFSLPWSVNVLAIEAGSICCATGMRIAGCPPVVGAAAAFFRAGGKDSGLPSPAVGYFFLFDRNGL